MNNDYVIVHFTHDRYKNELMILNEEYEEKKTHYTYTILILKLLMYIL